MSVETNNPKFHKVTVQTITATISSKMDIGNTKIQKSGHIVVISFNSQVTTQVPTSETLLSGLPKPSSQITGIIMDTAKQLYEVHVLTDGTLICNSNLPVGWYSGNFSYCTIE